VLVLTPKSAEGRSDGIYSTSKLSFVYGEFEQVQVIEDVGTREERTTIVTRLLAAEITAFKIRSRALSFVEKVLGI
jgi:hypothetical protein